MAGPARSGNHPLIVMGHGGGGEVVRRTRATSFLPAFANRTLNGPGGFGPTQIGDLRLAFSTDSFVVRPLFFPGGNIGDLAINGTVNDLASGAQPLFQHRLYYRRRDATRTAGTNCPQPPRAAATAAGAAVTGDTKVVDKVRSDGVYINTSEIGLIPAAVQIGPT
ncbi:MAG: hypothetical protein R2932_16775 [Caldilineaceae bacterium]